MVEVSAALLFYIPITLLVALMVADAKDRGWLSRGVLIAWAALAPITGLFDTLLPFSSQGDDTAYYSGAIQPVAAFIDLFDLTRSSAEQAQPGFPFLLSFVTFFAGPNLLAMKLLNLCFYILLAVVWYRTGLALISREFARKLFTATLLLTPMWFSVACLLKDMTIVLLQNAFLSFLVTTRLRGTPVAWGLVAASTLALLPFRTFLVAENVAVICGSVALGFFSLRRRGLATLITLIAGLVTAGSLVALSGDGGFLRSLGVLSDDRVVSVDVVQSEMARQGEAASRSVAFPLIYLLSEVGGLNPVQWMEFSFEWLRAVLAIPWILCVVPFFALGVGWIFKSDAGENLSTGYIARLRRSRFLATPWGSLMVFALTSFGIAWSVGDTTRYRLADMPVMAAIAVAGWEAASSRYRARFLFIWAGVVATAALTYHLIIKGLLL